MDDAPPAPRPSEVVALNARLAPRRITVGEPERTDDGRWQVRIETADGFAEFPQGPTAGHAWLSALAFVGCD